MKKSASKSILSTLFVPYTALFVVAFLLIASFFVATETNRIHYDTFLSIENNLGNIMDEFDHMVDSLNAASQNIVFANIANERVSFKQENDLHFSALSDLLVAIVGPRTTVDQIYLYGLSGGSLGIGRDNSISEQNVMDFTWYDNIKDNQGEKYVFLDKDVRLAPYYSSVEGCYFLTLSRKYYNSLNIPQGIVEVKKSIVPFVDSIRSYNRPYKEDFYIFTPEGTLLYPLPVSNNSDSPEKDIFQTITEDSTTSPMTLSRCNMKMTKSQYFMYETSEKTGFTSVAVINKRNLLTPIYDYVASSIVILLFVCFIIVIISYIIAHRISNPLGEIYSQLKSFELKYDDLAEKDFTNIDTSIIELDGLYKAFLEMQAQTRASIKREIELQNRELQSRMLALHAQMNPHFLYNSLATIQAMADEGMTDTIYYLCQNMSNILRYISSDNEQLVKLSDEISHTISYLECMKMRYEDQLSYSINIPENMMNTMIPKLCLQLIVENAIKFTTQKRGPWHISVNGRITSSDWEIRITDNGPGFSQEILDELNEKIKEIDQKGILPNLQISGMGLMNIYIRFKLLYQGNHIFRISNNHPEGAVVTIGGMLS